MNPELDDNICIKCGMCCDGTLFQYAGISEDEKIDPSYDFEIGATTAGEKRFFFPCTYLHNKCCSIYDHRPYKICDHYRCVTLKRLDKNEVSFQKAVTIIDEVLVLKEEIQNEIDTNFVFVEGKTFNEKINNLEKYYAALPDQTKFESTYRKLLFDIVKFKLLKDRHFYKNKIDEATKS